MKKKFLRIAFIVMAVVLTVSITACSAEAIYYLDTTGKVSSDNPQSAIGQPATAASSGGNSSSSDSGNSGSGSGNSGTGDNGSSGNTQTEDPNFKGDGTTYNLTVWCAEEDVEMINEMLDNYKDKYPQNTYNFKIGKQGEDIVSATVVRDVSAAADVFSFANDQLGTLISNNALATIPSAYHSLIDDQIDVAKIACTYKGEYYAIPYSYENCFLYYNKSLISKGDVASMEGILNKSIPGVDYNLGIDMGDSYYTTMFLYTAGVQIFGEQGTDPNSVDLDNEAAYKACRYIASLNSYAKLGMVEKADQFAALKNGKVAAMISGPHMISQFKDALGSNFAVAMLPTIRFDGETKDSQLYSFSGVKMYGVSRKDTAVRDQKTTDEAIKLAAYLANDENQAIRLTEREFCPTQTDLFAEAIDSGKETVEVVVEQSEFAKLKPGLLQMSNYWENMKVFLLGVYKLNYGESTWSTELKKIEAKLKS